MNLYVKVFYFGQSGLGKLPARYEQLSLVQELLLSVFQKLFFLLLLVVHLHQQRFVFYFLCSYGLCYFRDSAVSGDAILESRGPAEGTIQH